jgi:hypothetical protein
MTEPPNQFGDGAAMALVISFVTGPQKAADEMAKV